MSIGNITLSIADFHGSRVGSWSMIPNSRRGPVTGSPPAKISPPVMLSIPPIIISSVLLPQPLGPSSATNSPSATEKSAFRTASSGLPFAL